jgi:hypothetical protein
VATPKRIYKGQPTAAGGVLYTAPAGNGVLIKAIRAVNTEASVARWLRLGTGGTTDADLLAPQWAIDAQGMSQDDGLIILEPGQTLNGRAEVDAKITVHVFGMEM